MGRNKRPLDHENGAAEDATLPARKRRAEYSDADKRLAEIYNDLANEVEAVRSAAAKQLIRELWKKVPDRTQRLDNAIKRLIKGLCSGRKAARLGFSVPLPELLRLKFSSSPNERGDPGFGLSTLVKNIVDWTRADGGAKGQEKRDHLQGRRFAYQAVLQSDVGLNNDLPDAEWRELVECIFELAKTKQWLRRDCGAMLHNYLTSKSGSSLSTPRAKMIIDVLHEAKQIRTPEGVALWLTVRKGFPGVSFPKGIWHHNDPLSSKEHHILAKAMLETAQDDDADAKQGGYRQSIPSFAWSVVLGEAYINANVPNFPKFWEVVVAESLFAKSASAERKGLGLQIVSMALAFCHIQQIPYILHPNIVRCIIDQRAHKDKYLFEATKAPLQAIVARMKHEPTTGSVFIEVLLDQDTSLLDSIVRLKVIEFIIENSGPSDLSAITKVLRIKALARNEETPEKADNPRRAIADIILSAIRAHKGSDAVMKNDSEQNWVKDMLTTLADVAYRNVHATPEISPTTRNVAKSRLMSCMNAILDAGNLDRVWLPVLVLQHLRDHEADVLSFKLAKSPRKNLSRAQKVLDKAVKSGNTAFALLLALCMLEVYNEEVDSTSVLEDAVLCYESANNNSDSTVILIELLLSFISKSSALFRKVTEQVFSAFAAAMTEDSLQSLLDILAQKESLSGQQELFQQNDEMQENGGQSESDEDGEAEYEDVEDASDLEIANGEVVSNTESDSDGESEGSDDSSSDSSSNGDETSSSGEEQDDEDEDGGDDDDEEALFDRKLADALKTNGVSADSDDDGSDMDDDQMMELEPHLNKIFSERQKQTSKTKDKKDARENIINFKNRVLGLLSIFVKSQYANPLTLDLLLPLVALVRTTTSRPTGEKALAVMRQCFEACNKHKTLPVPTEQESCFEIIAALHHELKIAGGARLHATACSKVCLFVSKVLCSSDAGNYDRIADMYTTLLKEWRKNPKCQVQQSVFTEWMSWSIETRKRE